MRARVRCLALPRQVSSRRGAAESDAEWAARQEAARREVNGRLLVFLHGFVQALTAAGLLQLLPFKPRTVGFFGTLASAINCYFLLPAFPKRAAPAVCPAKPAALPAGLPAGAPATAEGKLVAKVA